MFIVGLGRRLGGFFKDVKYLIYGVGGFVCVFVRRGFIFFKCVGLLGICIRIFVCCVC